MVISTNRITWGALQITHDWIPPSQILVALGSVLDIGGKSCLRFYPTMKGDNTALDNHPELCPVWLLSSNTIMALFSLLSLLSHLTAVGPTEKYKRNSHTTFKSYIFNKFISFVFLSWQLCFDNNLEGQIQFQASWFCWPVVVWRAGSWPRADRSIFSVLGLVPCHRGPLVCLFCFHVNF